MWLDCCYCWQNATPGIVKFMLIPRHGLCKPSVSMEEKNDTKVCRLKSLPVRRGIKEAMKESVGY